MIKKTGLILYFSIIKLSLLILFIKPYNADAQSKPLFGIMVKPIIQTALFSTDMDRVLENGAAYQVAPEGGYNAGMIVRHRIYKGISLETGISYVKRGFNIALQDSAISTSVNFKLINYEIPVLGLIYIQLSEQLFINNAFGLSLHFFPNDIYTETDNIRHYTERNEWVLPALTANVGFEFRTKKSGFFYLGGSYNRMLTTLATSQIEYPGNKNVKVVNIPLAGHYFSVDMKYFLPLRTQDPEPMLY